jgi:hypothetical protein
MAEGKEERAHRERMSTARSVALELNGKVATAVFEVHEDDHVVREQTVVTMVCKT